MSTRLDRRSFLVAAGGVVVSSAATRAFSVAPIRDVRGIVTGYPHANDAGAEILAAGGNAIDAVVAAALAAGVVALPSCGIGGYGGHMIIGTAAGKLSAIDFNSTAPAAARPDMFQVDDKGNVKDKVNSVGWLAAGVPGTLAGLQLALDQFGSMKFARVVQPAIKKARDGFETPIAFKVWFDPAKAPPQPHDPASVKLFMPNGKLLVRGDTFRNPQLADLLQRLAESGSVEPFYRGDVAREIAAAFKKNGGIVTEKDFNDYHAIEQRPYESEYRGHRIATAPLTAGGLTVLQVFAALAALDWHQMKDGPTKFQAMVEALRIAWGDRLRWFGDPKFVDVPIERLLSEKYAKASARQVTRAVAEKRPVPVSTDDRSAGGTVNLTAVDAQGNMAVITLTHGDSFGARVTVDGMGLLLGHGMSRFEPVPGKLNSIAPGKRPLDNMCPSIVLKDGKPTVALGGVGGRRIPNSVFQTLLQLLANDRSLNDSLQAPRIHTEGGLELHVERGIPKDDVEYMRKIGYTIAPPIGAFVSAVQYSIGKDGQPTILAAADRQPELTVQPSIRDNSTP